MDEEQLKAARIKLKDVAATRARLEWRTRLADPEALNVRRMTQEIINHGNEAALESLATYFGIHLKPKKDTVRRNADGAFVIAMGNGQLVAVKIEKV